MPKRYLLMLSAAIATGYGLGASDLFEAQAISTSERKNVCIYLGAPAATTFENFIQTQLCPQVDTDFNLTSGTCTVAKLNERSSGYKEKWGNFDTDNDEDTPDVFAYRLCSHPTWPGSFVGDEP